ncbi:uncharacterized protein V1510DRAFT_419370 [Dipodascopsis tothii]|uniref:uncharacterized protein n=1 Tax=Dipodascopsis tothii TaxID=44089 RepID=UPI0034CFDBF4
MTQLDTSDGDGGVNQALEALQALAYEGTLKEVMLNFKNQGNEQFQLKQYKSAVEFYTKALQAKLAPKDDDDEDPDLDISQQEDKAAEERAVQELTVVCLANRAACNLELKNFRRTINDCTEALRLNPVHTKAIYRAGRASMEIGKFQDARDCVARGLEIEPKSAAFRGLSVEILQREDRVLKAEQGESEREIMKKHVVHI